jgi:Flp pilus assembly protein TadG
MKNSVSVVFRWTYLFRVIKILLRLIVDRNANFGLLFGLTAVPVVLGLGASVDFVRAYNVRVEMQANLDAALIAAVKRVDTLNESQIKTRVASWFTAQAINSDAGYSMDPTGIVVSTANRTVQATARGTVSTTFLGIANISSIPVSVSSSVAGPATSYMNVYIVLDKSASMLLAADSDGQTTMKSSPAGCVFACHIAEGGPWTYKNVKYDTNYKLAKAMGVTLRADVSVAAAKEVLSIIASADPTGSRIKVGLYTIGATATQVLAPTSSTSTASTTLDDNTKGLNSATSETGSAFDVTLNGTTNAPGITQLVGTAGDGTSVNTPLKLVLLLTDGVISQRSWVLNGVWWDSAGKMHGGTDWSKVAPFNPTWCAAMKTNKVTVGVLYTQYLAIPTDEGYVHTVGDTMNSANWSTNWSGTMRAGVSGSTTRLNYIPMALQDCATSSAMFLSAADSNAIQTGFSSLFQTYLGSVRLTQ